MPNAVVREALPSCGSRFLDAVRDHDFTAFDTFLAADVHFRFATPSKTKDLVGPASVAEHLEKWFGATVEQREWLDGGYETVSPGRTRVWYRLRVQPQPVTRAPGWHTIEQQVYVDAGPGPSHFVGLVCTGFMPDAAHAPRPGSGE